MRLSYDAASALVFDPVAANRNTTRASLRTLGFRHIDTVASMEDFEAALRQRSPDLALCEAHGAYEPLCDLIQKMRRGADGYNPFVVMIVTAWLNDQSLITRIVNSGADDLLLRPFSTTKLEARIRSHAERRKGFVITSDYVGPDRRRDTKKASNVEIFEPPNSLKMKAKERMSLDEVNLRLDTELKLARATLFSEKLRRDAFQVCVLWRLLQDHRPGSPGYLADLAKLKALTRDVSARCANSEAEGAVEHCDSVMAAIEGVEADVDRNASMHLLGHAALHLKQFFEPGKSEGEHLGEINRTVDMIHERQAQAAAQALAS